MATCKTVNPVDGEPGYEYTLFSEAEIGEAAVNAQNAFHDWRMETFPNRAKRMLKLADLLEAQARDLALLMASEMGKPLRQGEAEAGKCAKVCRYYAENAEAFLRDEPIESEETKQCVVFRPLGAILAIMPWNFPFWQVFRFAAPAVMAGNVALLKHASNVPRCAETIERLFRDAGFPKNVFTYLPIDSEQAEWLIENPIVQAVTLTGSGRAGRAVAAKAGNALKKTVLELGGSDPYVILEDADLERAAEVCVKSRLINSGQSCIAAKRFIVVESVREEFEKLFVKRMKETVMGDPTRDRVDIGPMARHDLRDALHRQTQTSVEKGAICLLGGEIPDAEEFRKGAFYPPTVLTQVAKGMPAYDEELFGPVAAIIPASGKEGAIKLANDSAYGLGAAIFSRDIAEAGEIARHELDAGTCVVNGLVQSDPKAPFGGIKHSGYGRELSRYGIREFVNVKTLVVSESA